MEPGMMAAFTAQRTKEAVYDAIARLLPFIPRDLDVAVTATPSKDSPGRFTTSIDVKPLTEMGRAIYPVLQKHLHEELSKSFTPSEDKDAKEKVE